MEFSDESYNSSEEESDCQDSVLLRLGYPECFIECFTQVLHKHLLYPRNESGVAVKPVSYFTRQRLNSLLQEYSCDRYVYNSKKNQFAYYLTVNTEVEGCTYLTKCNLEISPRKKVVVTDSLNLLPDIGEKCTFNISSSKASITWTYKAPVGFYDPCEWSRPAGILQAMSAVSTFAKRHMCESQNVTVLASI